MKKTTRKNGTAKAIFAIILSALMLASCADRFTVTISDGSGVGRDFSGTETEVPSTDAPENLPDTSVDGAYEVGSTAWALVDGKYTYYFGERDDSGMSTLSEMYNMQRNNLADQPDGYDWFFGPTTYDRNTGEVSYGWDRYDATLKVLEQYGGIYRGDETRKVCYITFDCGYEYGTTSQILDTLKEKNVPAIFFLTGHYVDEQYELMKRMLDEGHLIGNHTVNHKKMSTVTVDEFVKELNDLEAAFQKQFPDAQPLHYFRPPSGSCNDWMFKMADKMGYKTVMWSWAYYDYDTNNQPDVAASLEKAKNALHPGAVYLFHAESTTNVAILGDLIDWIRAQGYEILPICDIET